MEWYMVGCNKVFDYIDYEFDFSNSYIFIYNKEG